MPYFKTQNESNGPVNIFYHDAGKGDPVVLIHGWPVSHEMWEYQCGTLVEQGFRVISYDRRGFGQSDKPWDGYDYTSLAGDLKSLLETLDLENVTLVGFSMAGGEVVRYCSQNDCKRISKVVLVSSIAPYLLQSDNNPDGVPKEMFDEMVEKMKDDRPAFLADFGKTFFGQSFLNHTVSQEILDWMQGLALSGSPRATIQCLRSFSETDFRSEMKSIRVPTLVIHGFSDKTVPIKPTGEQAAALIPGAIYKVYDGAPHGLFITDKEELAADLVQFIQQGTINYNYGNNSAQEVVRDTTNQVWP